MSKPNQPANLFARSNIETIVEDVEVFPSGGPSRNDLPPPLLHNAHHDQGLSVSERSGNAGRGCYTSHLHNRPHLLKRGGRLYYRRRVPTSLWGIVGKREIWRSLKTDSPTVAVRRFQQVAADVERDLEAARLQAGLPIDPIILSRVVARPPSPATPSKEMDARSSGPTLQELYDAYMTDPTRDWSPRTRLAYETTRRVVLAVMGGDTPVRTITRAQCRDLIDTLRWAPSVGMELRSQRREQHPPHIIVCHELLECVRVAL